MKLLIKLNLSKLIIMTKINIDNSNHTTNIDNSQNTNIINSNSYFIKIFKENLELKKIIEQSKKKDSLNDVPTNANKEFECINDSISSEEYTKKFEDFAKKFETYTLNTLKIICQNAHIEPKGDKRQRNIFIEALHNRFYSNYKILYNDKKKKQFKEEDYEYDWYDERICNYCPKDDYVRLHKCGNCKIEIYMCSDCTNCNDKLCRGCNKNLCRESLILDYFPND